MAEVDSTYRIRLRKERGMRGQHYNKTPSTLGALRSWRAHRGAGMEEVDSTY